MEIRKSKETLILTRAEKAILLKARDMLNEIHNKVEADYDMEYWAREARNDIDFMLEDAEVENGDSDETVDAIVFM